jgi:hypothetical protein
VRFSPNPRPLALALALTLVLVAGAGLWAVRSWALPPYATVMEDLEAFRQQAGDLEGTGQLTYADFQGEPVRWFRPGSGPLRLELAQATLEADWQNTDLDIVLRLLGAALGREPLSEALTELAEPLVTEVTTLAFIEDRVVWVIGGDLAERATRLWIDRDTFRLLRLEALTPDGLYRLDLSEYTLAGGWFPAHASVSRGRRVLLELSLAEAGAAE